MIAFLSNFFSSIGSFFALKSTPNNQRRAAERDVRRRIKERERMKKAIEHAVYNRDDKALDALIKRLIPLLVIILFFVGCTGIEYVPADRKIESCTNSHGIACKAVPDALFVELINKAYLLEELQNQTEVDKRLQK